MAPLKIVLFGTPSRFSLRALEELAVRQRVAALVLPRQRAGGLRHALLGLAGLRRLSPIERAARELRIPILFLDPDRIADTAERLRELRPDLVCIAIFPKLLPPELTGLASLGAVNLHPSLLPRHRGPLPLFWTYHANDPVAGATVHYASQNFDAGDIIVQQNVPLPRGYPVAKLDADLAQCGATALGAAVELLANGRVPRVPQDEGSASYAPRLRPGTPMIDFAAWDVERVWHFLAGLSPRYCEPLRDRDGRPIAYRQVAGFERGTTGAPGTLEAVADGWKLACRGGAVLLRKSG
jgi:methionyl-tRNA formyltransferase